MIFGNRASQATSKLFDEKSFYTQFCTDLLSSKKEVIIECPYITTYRMQYVTPLFEKLLQKGVKLAIITRDPIEHEESIRYQSTNEILACQEMGIKIVFIQGNIHRKIAIIDRNILWEGSLNILSQHNSREVMRRTHGRQAADEMFDFLNYSDLV